MKKTAFFRVKKSYFPQISRLFTERPVFWAFSGLLFGIVASFMIWGFSAIKQVLAHPVAFTIETHKDTAALTRSYNEWKQVVEEKPAYRDGYVMLAWYAKELGKEEEEEAYIQKIMALDPSYTIPEVLQVDR